MASLPPNNANKDHDYRSRSGIGTSVQRKMKQPDQPKDIQNYIQLDYNKFSPTFGKYIVKKNDILLRDKNSSVYAPQRLDTEVSYLATGTSCGERDYDNRRIISFEKPYNGNRGNIDKLPHSFQSLHGNYTPGCKKKRLKHAVRRNKELLDVPPMSINLQQTEITRSRVSEGKCNIESLSQGFRNERDRHGSSPLLRRPHTASGSVSAIKLPKGYFLQARIKKSSMECPSRDELIDESSHGSTNQLPSHVQDYNFISDIDEAGQLVRPWSANSSFTNTSMPQPSCSLQSDDDKNNTKYKCNSESQEGIEVGSNVMIEEGLHSCSVGFSPDESTSDAIGSIGDENPFLGDEDAGIILDDGGSDGNWSGFNSLHIEQLQFQQHQEQDHRLNQYQQHQKQPHFLDPLIGETCGVVNYSIVADSSENNYHLSYQGSSLSFEQQIGSSVLAKEDMSIKSEWEPMQRTSDGSYRPYPIQIVGRRTAPRDIYNDAINSAQVMEKSYIQDFVLQSMRRFKGQTRRSAVATEMGHAIRADTIRIQKQCARIDESFVSHTLTNLQAYEADISPGIPGGHDGQLVTWETITASAEDFGPESYLLINRNALKEETEIARPSSAPSINATHNITGTNRNVFAAAVDPAVLLFNSTITRTSQSQNNNTLGNQAGSGSSNGGPIARIPDVGNVHLVLKPDGSMHSLQVTSICARAGQPTTRPVSANGHIPTTAALQTQLLARDEQEYGGKSSSFLKSDFNDSSGRLVATSSSNYAASSLAVDNIKSSLVMKLKEKIKHVKDIELLKPNGTAILECEPISAEQAREERRVLEELFSSLRGWRWKNSSGWKLSLTRNSGDDKECVGDRVSEGVSQWYGISTNTAGFVCEINLPENNLKGIIPDSIKNLSHLEVINLDGNAIGGMFPGTSLSKLTKLEVLSLRDNKLSGEIPWINLSYLELLRELWLTNNRFSGSLAKSKGYLGEMKNLTHLCIAGNKIMGELPGNELKYLYKLQLLSCGNNRLTGPIPAGLQACYGIANISLHNNKLSGKVPSWIGNFEYLMELNLFNNNFDGYVPRSIDDLRHVFRGDLGSLCDIDESSSCT